MPNDINYDALVSCFRDFPFSGEGRRALANIPLYRAVGLMIGGYVHPANPVIFGQTITLKGINAIRDCAARRDFPRG